MRSQWGLAGGANGLQGLVQLGCLAICWARAWPGSIWWQSWEPLGPRTVMILEASPSRAGGSEVMLPLVPSSGSEHRLSFWREELNSKATKEGSVQTHGDK